MRAIAERARSMKLGTDAAFLSTYVDILADERFRERADEIAGEGVGIPTALSRVAREVTRTAASLTRDGGGLRAERPCPRRAAPVHRGNASPLTR